MFSEAFLRVSERFRRDLAGRLASRLWTPASTTYTPGGIGCCAPGFVGEVWLGVFFVSFFAPLMSGGRVLLVLSLCNAHFGAAV